MDHMNIFTSSVYSTLGITAQLDTLVKFFINNRDIRIPVNVMDELYRTRILSETPMSIIFNNAHKADKLNELFSCIDIPGNLSIPEGLTTSNITLDIMQMKGVSSSSYHGISALPEYKDKLITNLTPLTKRTGGISDINELHSMLVRGLLVRSYFISKNWLNTDLIKYLGKSYSMTISTSVAKTYDLPVNDQLTIATALTAYFHQLVYGDVKDTEWSPTISRCEYLGDRFSIIEALEAFKEKLNGSTNINLNKVCELIAAFGPSRLSKFDLKTLYTLCQRLGTNNIVALMAVEYPPYWAHQVLAAFSGTKSGLYFALRNNGKLVSEGKVFADQLNRSNVFIPVL